MDLMTFAGPISGTVVGFRGKEQMSRPYHFDIFLLTTGSVELKSAIGAEATLTLDRHTLGFAPFHFSGVLANVAVIYAYQGQILVRAHLVPKLWRLSLSRHSRIFTMMRIPDIIALVLAENGVVDFELRLMGAYEPQEHVCQYRETDLDFVSRWMEKEGIFYFFEHSQAGEKLVLCDTMVYDHDPLGVPIPYLPQLGGTHDTVAPSFWSFDGTQSSLSTSVVTTDHNYAIPNFPIVGAAPAQPNGAGVVVRWGERAFMPPAAEKYAIVRAQELLAREAVYTGKGTRLHLRPGYMFTVDGHPIPSFNASYVAFEARHTGNQAIGHSAFQRLMGIFQEEVYEVEVDGIPSTTQFRAESVTRWPGVYGYEVAVTDGPAEGPYAQIDEMGRYKVKLRFDESPLQAGLASTWVRMMQPHGGDIEGFHFPLRKGVEVLIAFLDGDVDRPVMLGFVPNTTHPSPVTMANLTKNVIQTGGRNRLEFEDLAGSQWMHYSTPPQSTHLFLGETGSEGDHNFILETQGTGHVHTGNNHDLDVDQKWSVKVGDTLTEEVQKDVTEKYHQNLTQTVDQKKKLTTSAGEEEVVNSGYTQSISGGFNRTITGTYTDTLLGTHNEFHNGTHVLIHNGTLQYIHNGAHEYFHSGPHSHTRAGDTTETRQGDVSRTVTGDVGENVTGNVEWGITGGVTIGCKEAWSVSSKTGADFTDPVHFKVQVGGASLTIEPSKITLTNGPSTITLDGGQITVTGPKILVNGPDITVASSGPLALDGQSITMDGGSLIKADAGEILLNNG